MRRLTKWGSIVIFLMAVWTVYLYYHLDVGEEPQVADVIVVAGGQLSRETRAKELLDSGYSRSQKVVLSPITESEQMHRPPVNSLIINPENIIAEREATSTWTNATKSIEVMEAHGWKSALVVTSDFHTRRTRMAFERAALGKNLSFTYISSYPHVDGKAMSYLEYEGNDHWAKRELYKYWGYLFGLYYVFDL